MATRNSKLREKKYYRRAFEKQRINSALAMQLGESVRRDTPDVTVGPEYVVVLSQIDLAAPGLMQRLEPALVQ